MDNFIEELKKEIMSDEQNLEFTKQGQKPLFDIYANSRILVVGQAPGIKAMESGKCWNDQSGKNLRNWMGINEDVFYNSGLIGIVPMDFYYPGKGKSGDLPPRKGFAQKWHTKILEHYDNIKLILLVGSYSQNYYLKKNKKKTLTETVKNYEDYLPTYFPVVHPSPRNIIWQIKNPWFEAKVVPALRSEVKKILDEK
jgi:uracil DNA glycosylase